MDQHNVVESGGFYFLSNFDSGNLGHVERVPTELIVPCAPNPKTSHSETPDYEFNLWTRPDCAGTEFENGNRTWFYFGIQASVPNALVRLNLINLNKQSKMYAQGMAPVTRTLPGRPQWERIRDRPIHHTDDDTFTLSFKYRTSENTKATTFFAFTYPYSFAELQIALNSIDMKFLPLPPPQSPDDIYYYRECVIYSLEGRRVDLLTISSHHGITNVREERLKNLFPDKQERPFKFLNKKVIFISARVHPGETPSSFVFNGFLNLLLNRHDPIAMQLRRLYVFKMIPFLNPDGVARGHYRTDTRGVNLNRVYLNPSLVYHPTVYASRALIRFYHFGCEKEDNLEDCKSYTSRSLHNINESTETMQLIELKKKKSGHAGSSHKKKESKSVEASKSTTTLKSPSDLRRDILRVGTDTTNSDQARPREKGSQASKLPLSERKRENQRATQHTESTLAVQVCDMTLREMQSQTSASSSNLNSSVDASHQSLLNEQTLKTCLGSNVHLSTSEELQLQGNNPLQPLRQTLKNSISLLMDSPANSGGGGGSPERLQADVRMGWCRECRVSVAKLEGSIPGVTRLVPGYAEYEKISQEPREDGAVYFCTNCFKRYIISEDNEEIPVECVSVRSVAVPAGDGEPEGGEGEGGQPSQTSPSNGDSLTATDKPEKEKKVPKGNVKKKSPSPPPLPHPASHQPREPKSGLFLYLDLHGHASKKGIFMYGNHFEDVESCVECMLLPRIMELNSTHFHFASCNFTERNMYLKDRRDGMSREGSGRVAMYKTTGLVRCYTLECNYNTGRLVNVLPPAVREAPAPEPRPSAVPPKYTPTIFEEVGRSLGASILDVTGQHPNSRLPASEHRTLAALRDWLRAHTHTNCPKINAPRVRAKTVSPARTVLYPRPKGKITDERKENAPANVDSLNLRVSRPLASIPIATPAQAPVPLPAPLPSGSKPRFMQDDTKGKTVGVKRRNALSIRKPSSKGSMTRARRSDDSSRVNSSGKLTKRSYERAHRAKGNRCRALASSSSEDLLVSSAKWEDVTADGICKSSMTRARRSDDSSRVNSSGKLTKRSYERTHRAKGNRCRALTSSSSEDLLVPSAKWEDVTGGTTLVSETRARRRAFGPVAGSHARLKKIRLKARSAL